MQSSKSIIIENVGEKEFASHTCDQDLNAREQISNDGGALDRKNRHGIGNILVLSLPICLVFMPTFLILIAFVYAKAEGTLALPPTRDVPYISDLGNVQPQSSFFTLGLAFGAFFTVLLVIVRYIQVKSSYDGINPWINTVGLVTGLLIAVGQITVASFQLSTNSSVHYLGAVLYTFSAVIYIPIQTFISDKEMYLCGRYRSVFLYARGLLTSGVLLGFLIFSMFLLPPFVKFNRPGYSVAQSGEWCFAVFKMLYMLTFIVDFWKLQPSLVLTRS